MGIEVTFVGDQIIIIMSEEYHQMLCKNESITEMCRRVVTECGYKINGEFIAYRYDGYYMAEDEINWWYVGDIGHGLDVIGHEVYVNGEYLSIFDYTDEVVA